MKKNLIHTFLLSIVNISLLIFITACGFHLRGDIPLPSTLAPMYIDTKTPYNSLIDAIQATLSSYGIKQASSPKEANTILHILDIQSSEDLVSVSASTNTRQYAMKQTVTMELTDKNDKVIIPVSKITASNPLTVDSSQVLNMDSQKQTLSGEMNQAMVQQLMMKLGSNQTKTALAALNTSSKNKE